MNSTSVVTPEKDSAAPSSEDENAAAAGTEAATESARSWRERLPSPLTAVLIALLVVAVVFAVVFGWKLENRNDRSDAGRAALDAAQNYAVVLTSIDSAHLDPDIAAVLNGATGEFKDMYSKSADQLKPMLLQAKSVSKGHVVAASVQSASENHAVIMLFVDAEITNVTNPQPRIDRNRILMTMDKVGDRWLAAKVELP
ncbi:Mce-associated membrane protein [Nocardia transvalensis]|uniref:Mce-associated membrane protein n=1 Tax=Nocardia transvalensis TaxID=37333 RepID=A0A7W9UJJ5_9NOCA|nr:hypothetical protein [Nocardia transvalensis]MBB5915421.1 Mce-associated membrane protein [Nocardia transvalensis]